MLTVLVKRPIARIINSVRQSQVEGTIEQPQMASLDVQDLQPSPEMPQDPPNDHASASGDSSRTVRSHTNERHEGRRPRTASSTATHRHRGEHWSGRGDHLQSRFRAQTARLRDLEGDHHQLAGEHESLERSHCQLSEAHQIVIVDLHKTQATCKEQQQEINALREKLRSTSALLGVRNQELKVAKTFLSKEDPVSTSDIVQSVRDLNSEVMQTAAHLAENLPLKRVRTPSAEEVPEGPYKSIFVTLVLPQGSGEEVDVGSVELALQGFLTFYSSGIVNTWGFSHASGWYDKLYSKVCETEDNTVASNWRALTRRTLSRIDSSHEDLPRQILNGMVKQLAGLLSSCGVGDPVDNANNIHKYAAEKLGALFTTARKLNRMIGENVVSEDLTVTVIRGGTMFDGERMEDTYVWAGVKTPPRAVICTTDLGLCERKQTKGVRKLLLKPKVALHDS